MSSDHLKDPGESPERGGAEQSVPVHRGESGWRWRLVMAMILGAILVLLALIVLALYGANRNDKANASEQTLGDLAEQVRAACVANPVDARKVFGDVCGKAKAIDERPAGEKGDPGATGAAGARGPQGPQGEPGPQGPRGPVGPTGMNGHSPGCLILVSQCQGPQGTPGAPGLTGPPGQPGEQGEPGEPGVTGAQGIPGEPGPKGEAGAKGDTGAQGVPGTPGRGIADTDCLEDGTWRITYTDGTTSSARGPCRVVAVAPPIN